ncbi:MAG TPA: DUF1580 domain-containing protein [Lacipirellulaceae bacterium]|nr:DUF1580 domain-containing protein [Lacipirellulaceae bacterium]
MHFIARPSFCTFTVIDYENEQLLTMSQAAKLMPGRPNIATIWRWRTSGCRGHKLETILVGGRRFTSREATGRFLAALNDEDAMKSVTPAQRAKAIESAEKRAEKLRI